MCRSVRPVHDEDAAHAAAASRSGSSGGARTGYGVAGVAREAAPEGVRHDAHEPRNESSADLLRPPQVACIVDCRWLSAVCYAAYWLHTIMSSYFSAASF